MKYVGRKLNEQIYLDNRRKMLFHIHYLCLINDKLSVISTRSIVKTYHSNFKISETSISNPIKAYLLETNCNQLSPYSPFHRQLPTKLCLTSTNVPLLCPQVTGKWNTLVFGQHWLCMLHSTSYLHLQFIWQIWPFQLLLIR